MNAQTVIRGGGCLLLLLGALLMVAPAGYTVLNNQFQASRIEVPGTVVSLRVNVQWDSDSNRDITYYCPIVEYTTLDGQTFTFDSINCSSPAQHAVGDTVAVLYPPDDPGNGAMKNDILNWILAGFAWSVGGMGLCLSVVGVAGVAFTFFGGRKQNSGMS